ncbi:hypothetical protein G6F57_018151 [Rhizopus arrhizus]|nr:hypothetical protein G6F57_018151 [Rhizopus arrhizus]
MVGESGRGLAVLLEMAATTRLDCVLGSAALLRQALVQSLHHAQHRQAFGKPLIEQPLMRHVLADLALESEAAMVLALRLARAVDARADAPARALVRVGTPAAKLWICKRAIHAVAECMEVWGGNGYVEEGPMPRIYRETPVNSIWEGSGNVMALDEWETLFKLSDRYGFVIASDECYSEIYLDEGNPPLGSLQAARRLGRDAYRNLVAVSSLSKRSNVPGLRSER